MRVRTVAVVGVCRAFAIGMVAVTSPASAAVEPGPAPALAREPAVAREPADPKDGAGGGTVGGSKAAVNQIFVVTSRAELVKALGGDNSRNGRNPTPKIVLIKGEIDLRADDQGKRLECAAFSNGFSYDAYLTVYDPAVYGRDRAPSGILEDARAASVLRQAAHSKINIGSNTTILGLAGARLRNGTLNIEGVDNVILRNLDIATSTDCFPQWDATDGRHGSFNAEFDTVSVVRSSKVWIDHNTFSDGDQTDLPERFGVTFEVFDGLLDITKESTQVTVAYNDFRDHDKTLLIGSSDADLQDRGRLAVTVHHNRFAVGQRAPRVRFGEVDVFNNLYLTDIDGYKSSFGVGFESKMVLQNNFVVVRAGQPLGEIIDNLKGTALTELGTLVKVGAGEPKPVSVLAEHNAASAVKLGAGVDFVPTLRLRLDPAATLPRLVSDNVGTGRLNVGS